MEAGREGWDPLEASLLDLQRWARARPQDTGESHGGRVNVWRVPTHPARPVVKILTSFPPVAPAPSRLLPEGLASLGNPQSPWDPKARQGHGQNRGDILTITPDAAASPPLPARTPGRRGEGGSEVPCLSPVPRTHGEAPVLPE